MTLNEWMAAHDVSPEQFAAKVGVHWATVYKWRSRAAFPRVAQLREIERVTGGAVTARDFMPDAA